MGLFAGLFPAAEGSKSTLFSSDSVFRRPASNTDDTSTRKRSAAPALAEPELRTEQKAVKKARKEASAATAITEGKALKRETSSAPEAAVAGKGRIKNANLAPDASAAPADNSIEEAEDGPKITKKSRARAEIKPSPETDVVMQDASAAQADTPLGKATDKPVRMKKAKLTAEVKPLTEPQTDVPLHETQTSAVVPVPNAAQQQTKASTKRKASKKAPVAQTKTSVAPPSDSAMAPTGQNPRKQTAQQTKHTQDHGLAESAEDLNMKDDGEDGISADADADMAETAARTAGEGAAAKPKLTEEQREERLQRTVFVGNLPAAVKAKRLKQAFSQFGAVESVRLRSIPLKEGLKMPRKAAIASGNVDAERAPAHAYIVFGNRNSAVYALQLNMTEFEGRHIRVDLAAGVSKSIRGGGKNVLYDSSKSVFLGNLPFDVTEEDLIRLFGGGNGAGNVTAVRVVRDAKTNKGKGIAYVEFQARTDARMALGFDGHTLDKRAIRVSRIASGPAAAEQQRGDSMLRTPYSKGVKPGKSFSAGRDRDSHSNMGAPGRSSAVAWQGMRTKGQSKLVKGSAAKPRDTPAPEGAKKAGQNPAQPLGMGKRAGKRPAVAARKAQKGRK